MLPNLKIVICAVMFAVIAFAVTGAGVHLPETYTRIGEMPEIGRPMMQRMITDEPAQAQFHILTLTRRAEELDQLRERSALEIVPVFAPANPEPDIPKPAVIENPNPDAIAAVPALQPSGAMGTVQGNASGNASGIASDSVQARPVAANLDGASATPLPAAVPGIDPAQAAVLPAAVPDADPVQVAALPPTADAKPPEPLSGPHARVPHVRPAAKATAPKHSFHRVHRLAPMQSNALGQGMFGQPFQTR
jgi:hypothetical protein